MTAAVVPERRYIKSNAVLDRYGITAMTLYRWIRDSKLGFPKPVVINGVRFFALVELDAFDERRRSIAGNNSGERRANQPDALDGSGQ